MKDEQTRYGFKQRPLCFENEEQQEFFNTRSVESLDFCEQSFVASVGGRIFKIDAGNYRVKQICCE